MGGRSRSPPRVRQAPGACLSCVDGPRRPPRPAEGGAAPASRWLRPARDCRRAGAGHRHAAVARGGTRGDDRARALRRPGGAADVLRPAHHAAPDRRGARARDHRARGGPRRRWDHVRGDPLGAAPPPRQRARRGRGDRSGGEGRRSRRGAARPGNAAHRAHRDRDALAPAGRQRRAGTHRGRVRTAGRRVRPGRARGGVAGAAARDRLRHGPGGRPGPDCPRRRDRRPAAAARSPDR